VALALAEFVPGKVNKRFARKDKIRESHWLELPEPTRAVENIELAALAVNYEPMPTSAVLGGEVL
jgi:hypothetical protein